MKNPNPDTASFNPSDRQREKQESRERDEERLRLGEISREELNRENSLFGAFDVRSTKVINRRARLAKGGENTE